MRSMIGALNLTLTLMMQTSVHWLAILDICTYCVTDNCGAKLLITVPANSCGHALMDSIVLAGRLAAVVQMTFLLQSVSMLCRTA